MKVLILSCNTGEGHNAAGRAMEEKLQQEGQEAKLIDLMALKSEKTSKLVGNAYIKTAKNLPWLFHSLYKIGGWISSPKHKSPVYWANSFLAKYLEAYLKENSYDILLLPHLFPAETITYMKRHKMLSLPVVAITTDYTCIPFWEETECDYYILPHADLIEEYVARGFKKEQLLPFGIPISSKFLEQGRRKELRARLGLPSDCLLYLVMSGSMGFGKIQFFAHELVKACNHGEEIVIICGTNVRLRKLLVREFNNNKQVHIIGYTNHVSEYMETCDIIYTKPGGLTSTEAAVKGIPMIHTAPIPGCETKNLEFFTSHKMSLAASRIKDQVTYGQMLAHNKKQKEQMRKAQQENTNAQASYEIYQLLLTLISKEKPDGA